jgi:hypothetical protein
MYNCCLETVPQPDCSFETFAEPVSDWQARLTAGLARSIKACDQNLGDMEEEILQQTRGLERQLLAEAAQKKADQTPARCPVCGHALSRCTRDHERTFQSRFGPVTIKRLRGWCRRCRAWRFPADQVLGLSQTGGASPSVQEMAALTVSKMPVLEASAVIERLTGVKLPPATLDREARRQGQQAEQKRQRLDEQMRTAQGVEQVLALPEQPFTLVVEIDAWNIRERDDWGQSAQQRAQGVEPARWHWVYGATCFRLEDRVREGQRARILSRGTVMTRGGVDSLREQLWAEAMRHGLAGASRVLVIADGAVWIWNLVDDRFEKAEQRLDLFHAKEHLWAVARALHSEDEAAAEHWVQPLLKDLEQDRAEQVIRTLESLLAERRQRAAREAVEKEINYFASNLSRMKYRNGKRRSEPLGSGAIESSCRQYQCRFKRPGQFWTRTGDEALMCLETFWRNDRWHVLYPHVLHGAPHRN